MALRPRLGSDDLNEDTSTNTPKSGRLTRRQSYGITSNTKQEPYSRTLENVFDDPVKCTPKKIERKARKKAITDDQIIKDLGFSDDESCHSSSKDECKAKGIDAGKDKKDYTCTLKSEGLKMIISIPKSPSIECVFTENEKVNNQSNRHSVKSRSTVSKPNYNEDALWKKHEEDVKKIINSTGARKRQNPIDQQQDFDENEMNQANIISSPPKRPKSETNIKQTPKKSTQMVDASNTPKSAAKRKIDYSSEPKIEGNNTRATRRNAKDNTAKNYKEWSSSDDNLKNDPRVVLSKCDKNPAKKINKKNHHNVEKHDSEDSEMEMKRSSSINNIAFRNTRSSSKAPQTPSKHQETTPYSPSKAMKNLKLNSDVSTPKRSSVRNKITPLESTPSKTNSNTENQGVTLRQSIRLKSKPCNIPIDSEAESADSSDEYKEDEDSRSEDSSSDSGDDSAEESHNTNRHKNWNKSQRKSAAKRTSNKKDSKVSMNTPTKAISRMSLGTPSLDKHRRTINIIKPSTPLQEARAKLHVSVLPKSLPCREEQFNDIYSFLHARLSDGSGGCIYISGVPGTGKTATVSEVIRCLKKSMVKRELAEFDYIDINGMKLSEPRQAYVQIWKQMSGETKTWEEAQKLLHNKFTNSNSKQRMTLFLVDELDLLCTKRQDVVYNLLDWPSKTNAKLVVVTIANTMDLPERILMGKVTSRLGLTRLTFPPYNFKQLEEIVVSRLRGFNAFGGETIQLVARKVAAVSGDARRALDICRRSAEIAEQNKRDLVSMIDVKQALDEMIASPKIQAIKHCSDMEKYFLQAVCSEVHRTGVEEVVFKSVYVQMETLCSFDGIKAPNITLALEICARLGAYRLLLCDHSRMDIHQRLLLNVSTDDVHFATKNIDA